MKLHIKGMHYHGPLSGSYLEEHATLQNCVYTALLVIGIPVTVVGTMFIVRHLFDSLAWLLPG